MHPWAVVSKMSATLRLGKRRVPCTVESVEALLTKFDELKKIAEMPKTSLLVKGINRGKYAKKTAARATTKANNAKAVLARERYQAKILAISKAEESKALAETIARGVDDLSVSSFKAPDYKMSPEVYAYLYGGGKHSRVADFPVFFAGLHVLFPFPLMNRNWKAMVNAQKKQGHDGLFKTKEEYELFEEYYVWAEDYTKKIEEQ